LLAAEITTQSVEAPLDATDVTDGKRVLDIACGACNQAHEEAPRGGERDASADVTRQKAHLPFVTRRLFVTVKGT
jgi:cytochrome c5